MVRTVLDFVEIAVAIVLLVMAWVSYRRAKVFAGAGVKGLWVFVGGFAIVFLHCASDVMPDALPHITLKPISERTDLLLDISNVVTLIAGMWLLQRGMLAWLPVVASLSSDVRSEREARLGASEAAETAELAASESRNLLRTFADSAPVTMFAQDLAHRYTFANKAMAARHGKTVNEIVGRTSYDLFPREIAQKLDENSDRVVVTRQAFSMEEAVLLHDGQSRTVLSVKAPMFGAEGAVNGICGVVTDITEVKQAEEVLRNSEQELERRVAQREAELRRSQAELVGITSNLYEGVVVVDAAGTITFANRSCRRMLLAQERDLEGTAINSVFRLASQSGPISFAASPFQRTATNGAIATDDDAVFEFGNGQRLAVAYACAPLDDEGARRLAIISFRSIEALKEAQREALQSSRLASVGQLAAGIAHEINTPIQYIGDNLRFIRESFVGVDKALRGMMATIDEGRIPQPVADDLRRLFEKCELDYLLEELPTAAGQSLNGVDHVSHIVRSMKEFSHPGTTAKVATDINRAIASTMTVSTNEWKHVARVETELDPALPAVLCFPADLNQVLLNLIVNASHAIASLGRSELGTIRISTRRDGSAVEIRVADSGPGVPPAIRERIFDPFFTTKDVGRGTGQGLAISLDVIVNKHGGKIYLDEGVTQGAVFVIKLPIGDANV
jgi:PAS domain S-box-containing protein